jgi:hypothetical protein
MKAQVRESHFNGLDEMQFSLRASSSDRLWAGMEAATYEVSAGVAERPPAASHILVMHLSASVAGACRCGGPTQMRVMDPGDMDFVPLGYEATWQDRSPGRVLNVRFGPSFVRSTAATLGTRGVDAVSIAPQLHFRDAALEHLARALVTDLENGDTRDRLFAESVGTAMAAHLLQPLRDPLGALPSAVRSSRVSAWSISARNEFLRLAAEAMFRWMLRNLSRASSHRQNSRLVAFRMQA